MNILAHRGFWLKESEKNTMNAFKRAFSHGYGIETDVRDYCGEIVVSHNIADEACILFESVLELHKKINPRAIIAINIKSDGLQDKLVDLIEKYDLQTGFVFDMSIPEQVMYAKKKIQFFSRQSELEPVPVQYDLAAGIWMDEWEEAWIDNEAVLKCIRDGKEVSIISPEIHGRDNMHLWNKLKLIKDYDVMLCTDIPSQAKEFFYA